VSLEPVASWRRLWVLVPPTAVLVLAALVIRQFSLESRSFYQVFILVAAAFPVHALVPFSYRLPLFAMVSLAGIALVFGVRDGATLVGAGCLLIGVCHLPVRFGVRVVLVLALAGLMALARANVISSPIPGVVWPILGSMFMFRLALYLHTLRHEPGTRLGARTLSYFFMLPNVCYPLFPVVDFGAFRRSHYDAEAGAIYERGIKWIVRGLVHLLIYRLVYRELTLDTAEVTGLGSLVQALLSVFFLYLRISGEFHLVIGILHLFGFRLPETHRLYFLASSITDYWRRINIYWKDFMTKLVFYPSFFWLRGRGERFALAGATMLVFVATWALHSYQWFWLRSEFPVTPQDLAFWGLLGGLVVITSLREAKRGRQRSLAAVKRRWNPSLAVRTVGTFLLLCVLWSLWSTESISDWLWIWSAAGVVEARDLLLIGLLLVVGLAIGGIVWDAPVAPRPGPLPFYRRPLVQSAAILVLLLAVGNPWVRDRAPPSLGKALATLQSTALNPRDAAVQHKGYYENLDDRGRLSTELWNVVRQRPQDWRVLSETEAYLRKDREFLRAELRPLTQVRLSGQVVTINRWGMRDRDYPMGKAAGTSRIALLGPSYVMGMGVPDGQTIDAYLEDQLNEAAQHGRRYEVLNFGVAAYSLVQQLRLLDVKVYQFAPDVVIITDTRTAAKPVVAHLTRIVADGIENPYPGLREIVQRAGIVDFDPAARPLAPSPLRLVAAKVGVESRPPFREIELRLGTVADEMVSWALRYIAQTARAQGAVPVFLAMSNVTSQPEPNQAQLRSARDAGFLVLDLYDLYDGQPLEALRVAEWDNHPNARATRMIAERLHLEFRRHESVLRLGLTATREGQVARSEESPQ
jgi:D-alanyl-lipoteichoic acid acyltransferase DltB (MBOAT superfamily)